MRKARIAIAMLVAATVLGVVAFHLGSDDAQVSPAKDTAGATQVVTPSTDSPEIPSTDLESAQVDKPEPEFVYAVRQGTEIVRVSLGDGSIRKLSDIGGTLGESRRITVLSHAPSGLVFYSAFDYCSPDAAFWAIDTETLSTIGPFVGGAPSISPDGSRVAVTATDPDSLARGCTALRVIPVEALKGSEGSGALGVRIDVFTGPDDGVPLGSISQISWSSTGTTLIVTGSYEDVVQHLVAADGSKSQPLNDEIYWDNDVWGYGGLIYGDRSGYSNYDPIAIEEDGSILALASCGYYGACREHEADYPRVLHRYDLEKDRVISTIEVAAGRVFALTVDPHGSRIACLVEGEGPGRAEERDNNSLVLIDEAGTERVIADVLGGALAWG